VDPNTNSDSEQQKWPIKIGIFVEKLVVFPGGIYCRPLLEL
jgi:hypothetical protein